MVRNMRGIVQNGTKERSVRHVTHLLKQSEFRGQIIESYQSPNDSLNFILGITVAYSLEESTCTCIAQAEAS